MNEDKYQKIADESPSGTWRVQRRYHVPASLSFRDIMGSVDAAKKLLGFPFYAVTVNFSPQIALAMVPDLPTLRNKEARLNCLTLPPAGTIIVPYMLAK